MSGTPNYRAVAAQAAQKYGIPVQPFLRQLNQESGFRPGLTSPAGARWIGQFIPSTARAYGVHDDLSSIYGAAHYMADNLKRYGTMARALSAYNSGKPDAYLNPAFAGGQTYNYVKNILGGQNIPVGPAAVGGAPATPPPAGRPPRAPAVAAPPAPAGIPLDVQQILNRNNELAHLAPVDYGTPAPAAPAGTTVATVGPNRIPVVKAAPGRVSPNAAGVIQLAHKYLGTPYVWGGTTPKGFDCSGFVQYLYAQKGIQIPRTTYEQFKAGTPVARGKLKPGDVVFFEPGAQGPGHEALYIGGGQVIEAPHTGDVVKIQRLSLMGPLVGARRMG